MLRRNFVDPVGELENVGENDVRRCFASAALEETGRDDAPQVPTTRLASHEHP